MNQLYREQLLDHYKNPRNHGRLVDATHSATFENLSCGDKITMYLKIQDDKVVDIKFQGEGCAICIAAASMFTEHVQDKTVSDLYNMDYEDVEEMIGVSLSPSRIKCAHLGLLATQKALKI